MLPFPLNTAVPPGSCRFTDKVPVSHVLVWGTIPVFAWHDWDKPQRTSVKTAHLWTEIWTQNMWSTMQSLWSVWLDSLSRMRSECASLRRSRMMPSPDVTAATYLSYHVHCKYILLCAINRLFISTTKLVHFTCCFV
jgi:hypothetical protein